MDPSLPTRITPHQAVEYHQLLHQLSPPQAEELAQVFHQLTAMVSAPHTQYCHLLAHHMSQLQFHSGHQEMKLFIPTLQTQLDGIL